MPYFKRQNRSRVCQYLTLIFIYVLYGCGSGRSSASLLTSISLAPNNPSIAKGTSQQFTATAIYSDGTTKNISSLVIWGSGNNTVVTINKDGLAVARTIGSTLITATLGSKYGNTKITVPSISQWTWVSGSNLEYQSGVYGTLGLAASSNIPGARIFGLSSMDENEDLWLFGGIGIDSTGNNGYLNDLWKFDGTNWTWVSGGNIANQLGIYGIMGTASSGNIPGGRYSSVSWIDGNGYLWLFGGSGYDSAGTLNYLNDLWKFDGTNWTWISGSNIVNQEGIYGTQGIAGSGNIPGARYGAIGWLSGINNRWLFGGKGYDSTGTFSYLNDLWKFDGTNWTWVSGSNIVNQDGIYGDQGTPAAGNVPGARFGALKWSDLDGNLWLFGGYGYDASGTLGNLNDLWEFDGTNWTWVSGSEIANQDGIYGVQGSAAAGNVPGARFNSTSWFDESGNIWLSGGLGYDSVGTYGFLNDLWKFDGTNWTWMSGSDIANQVGVFGTKQIMAPGNIPGGREGSVSWIDGNGRLWLFGGLGYNAGDTTGYLNDLWMYEP